MQTADRGGRVAVAAGALCDLALGTCRQPKADICHLRRVDRITNIGMTLRHEL